MTSRDSSAPPSSSALTAKLAGADAHVAQFSGALDDLSVADLIQILQLARKSAAVVVTHDDTESRLWCVAGEIVDAESGILRGEAAVHRILGLERGWLKADLRSPARARRIFAGTQRLLLEAARRKDESVALRETLGDPQRCYRLAPGLAAVQLGLSAGELGLLSSFVDAPSLAEVFEWSELGDFETLTALTSWKAAGYLVEAGLRPTPSPAVAAGRAAAAPQALGTLRPLVASTGSTRPPGARAWTLPSVRNLSGSVPRVWAIVAVLLLTPFGYLLGSRTEHSVEREATPSLPPFVAAAAPLDDPGSFDVQLRIEPPEAEIRLDGEQAGSGRLETELPRDGVPHELRVEAPGFLPLRILFVDTAPPLELELEPLPALGLRTGTPARGERGVDSASPASPAAGDAAKARKRPAPVRAPLRREAPRPSSRPRPHAANGSVREASARPIATSSASGRMPHALD